MTLENPYPLDGNALESLETDGITTSLDVEGLLVTIASKGGALMLVDLRDLNTPARMLNRIFKLLESPLVGPRVVSDFLVLVDLACCAKFGSGVREALCPCGESRKVHCVR